MPDKTSKTYTLNLPIGLWLNLLPRSSEKNPIEAIVADAIRKGVHNATHKEHGRPILFQKPIAACPSAENRNRGIQPDRAIQVEISAKDVEAMRALGPKWGLTTRDFIATAIMQECDINAYELEGFGEQVLDKKTHLLRQVPATRPALGYLPDKLPVRFALLVPTSIRDGILAGMTAAKLSHAMRDLSLEGNTLPDVISTEPVQPCTDGDKQLMVELTEPMRAGLLEALQAVRAKRGKPKTHYDMRDLLCNMLVYYRVKRFDPGLLSIPETPAAGVTGSHRRVIPKESVESVFGIEMDDSETPSQAAAAKENAGHQDRLKARKPRTAKRE